MGQILVSDSVLIIYPTAPSAGHKLKAPTHCFLLGIQHQLNLTCKTWAMRRAHKAVYLKTNPSYEHPSRRISWKLFSCFKIDKILLGQSLSNGVKKIVVEDASRYCQIWEEQSQQMVASRIFSYYTLPCGIIPKSFCCQPLTPEPAALSCQVSSNKRLISWAARDARCGTSRQADRCAEPAQNPSLKWGFHKWGYPPIIHFNEVVQ